MRVAVGVYVIEPAVSVTSTTLLLLGRGIVAGLSSMALEGVGDASRGLNRVFRVEYYERES